MRALGRLVKTNSKSSFSHRYLSAGRDCFSKITSGLSHPLAPCTTVGDGTIVKRRQRRRVDAWHSFVILRFRRTLILQNRYKQKQGLVVEKRIGSRSSLPRVWEGVNSKWKGCLPGRCGSLLIQRDDASQIPIWNTTGNNPVEIKRGSVNHVKVKLIRHCVPAYLSVLCVSHVRMYICAWDNVENMKVIRKAKHIPLFFDFLDDGYRNADR